MASLNLAPEELRALESSRNRLFQLTNNLGSLKNGIINSNPLPTPESLQHSAFILQKNLDSIQQIMNENAALFQRLVIHPSTNFPGRTQENVLLQLLRKKLEPDVEVWAVEGRGTAATAGVEASKLGGGRAGGNGYYGDEEDEYQSDVEDNTDPLSELWEDARQACQERIENYVRNESNQPYTEAEREMGIENVRTGLKRNLDDSDEEDEEDEEEEDDDNDDDDDEDDEMADAGQGAGIPPAGRAAASGGAGITNRVLEPEHILWFSARGDLNLPANIELQSQRGQKQLNKNPGAAR